MSRTRRMFGSGAVAGVVAVSVLTGCATMSKGSTAQKDWPGISETKAIAEEGFIYGLPIVMNYAVMYEYAVDRDSGQFKAPFNQIKNEARVFTDKDTAIVTPNSDTPYSFLWMDLRAEPLVLSVPVVQKGRYYAVQLEDGNTFNFGYIGSRATGNAAGDYMVVGPDWKGATPPGIKKVFASSTQFAIAGYRTQLFNPADMPNVVKVQAGYKAAAALGIPETTGPTRGTSGQLPEDRQGDGDDELLRLSRLRLAVRSARAGREGDPDEAGADRHRSGQDLRLQGSLARAHGRSGPRHEGGRRKGRSVSRHRGQDHQRLEDRLMVRRPCLLQRQLVAARGRAKAGIYGNDAVEATYPMTKTLAGPASPSTAARPTTRSPSPPVSFPPVNAFWSVTMYDGRTQLLVENPIDRFLINSPMLPKLKKNPDGFALPSTSRRARPVGARNPTGCPRPTDRSTW